MVTQSTITSANINEGQKTLDELLELTQEYIHAIYRTEEIKNNQVKKVEWRITSHKLTTEEHYIDKKSKTLRFASASLQEAVQSFFDYLTEQGKI
jgi:hypothetical protein